MLLVFTKTKRCYTNFLYCRWDLISKLWNLIFLSDRDAWFGMNLRKNLSKKLISERIANPFSGNVKKKFQTKQKVIIYF